MEHQDWNAVSLNAKKSVKFDNTSNPKPKPKPKPIIVKQLISNEPIGKLIAQSRLTLNKDQKQFAALLGVSQQMLSRWECNKELPTNAQIALIEKTTKVKLPRCKKMVVSEE
jgi:DNA-binding transcriptional regulator YiaG